VGTKRSIGGSCYQAARRASYALAPAQQVHSGDTGQALSDVRAACGAALMSARGPRWFRTDQWQRLLLALMANDAGRAVQSFAYGFTYDTFIFKTSPACARERRVRHEKTTRVDDFGFFVWFADEFRQTCPRAGAARLLRVRLQRRHAVGVLKRRRYSRRMPRILQCR